MPSITNAEVSYMNTDINESNCTCEISMIMKQYFSTANKLITINNVVYFYRLLLSKGNNMRQR